MLELFGRKIKLTKLTVITGITNRDLFRELNSSNSTLLRCKYFGSTDIHRTPLEQRQIAKEVVQCVKEGVDDVILITNSDFCVKELNLYIMIHSLNHDISKTYPEYPTGCGLDYKLVSAYDMFNGELVACDINENMGIEVKSFDKEIDYQNEVSSHIYYGREGWY